VSGCFLMPIGRSAFPGKTGPIRASPGLQTKACETKPIGTRPVLPYFVHNGEEKRRFRGDTRGGGSIVGTGPQTRYFAFGNPWPPSERTFPAGVKKRFRAGETSDRPWAEGFAPDSTAASGTLPQELASSADGRSEIVPPMNRRYPTPRRMVRGYGSHGEARGSESPLNRLLSSPWAVRERRMSPHWQRSVKWEVASGKWHASKAQQPVLRVFPLQTSHFTPPPCETKPIWAGRTKMGAGGRRRLRRHRRGSLRQTNPICPARAGSFAAAGDKRTKRSQFPADGQERARAGKVVRTGTAGPKRAKQSQFLPSDTEGRYFAEKEL